MAGACLSHVKYCIRHSWRNHYQEEGKAGYSEAGDDAAKESVLGFAYGSTREAMLEQIATAYHMAACINPEVERSGMAIEGTVFACNVMGATERELPTGRVKFVWPPHGATDVQRGFNNTGELPMPIPGSESDYRMKIGQVIMARVDGEGPYALKVTTPRGAAIEGTLTTPSNGVDNPGIDENNGLVILAPHSALPANTLLTATLTIGSGKDQVVRVWRFKTGSLLVRVSHRGRGRRRRR